MGRVVSHIQSEEQMLVQVVMVVTLMMLHNQALRELRIDQVLDMVHLVMLVVQVQMAKLYTTALLQLKLTVPLVVTQ